MKKKRFFVILVILYLLLVRGALAQTEQFKFKHLDISDGLSHHEITSIFKDSQGFIWIGTAFGLNRLDGYAVKSFLHDARDTTSLPNNWIAGIFQTPDERLVVSTLSGLVLYNPENERFERQLDHFYAKYGTSKLLNDIVRGNDGSFWFVEQYRLIKYLPSQGKTIVVQNIEGDSTSIVNDLISDFALDGNGNPWIVHSNGIVENITVKEGRGHVNERVYDVYDFNNRRQDNYKILVDRDGDLWFCAGNLTQSVLFYDKPEGTLRNIRLGSADPQRNINYIAAIVESEDGLVWIGTDHGGINIIDKKKFAVRSIYHQDGDDRSLSESSIKCFYRDDQGIIWAGTYKRGVSYYHKNLYRFDVYKHNTLDPTSLPFEDINTFAEDGKGNLWIGTNGGGLLYFDRSTGKFRQYQNEAGNANSLSGNVIVSLCMDSDQNLWIGTYNNGLTKFDGKRFTRFKRIEGDSTSLPSQNIWEIFEDSKGRIWIGTLDTGVALLDKRTGKFERLRIWGPNALQSNTIGAITEDSHGNIWFGSINGVDILSADGKTFTHYGVSPDYNSLSSNDVLDIEKDSQGRIWIGTMDGLNLFDSTSGFQVYKEQLPHSVVLTILEDDFGKLWISTLNGVCEMNVPDGDLDNVSVKHYTESDGLQGFQFNLNASFKTRGGELIFGGPTGFNIYSPERHGQSRSVTKIVFSELELFEKPVRIGEKINGVVVLNKSISKATEIVLPPGKNYFSIKFSALNYFNPEKTLYLYKMEGMNADWLSVDTKTHEIVFNGLNPGHYVLRVRAANGGGLESGSEATLSITIQPPFWKTEAAFALYAFIIIGILFVTRKMIQQREKLKFSLEHERREAQRIHELDMMKVKFFTNVSHEFRTPLTLILTPIEKLIKKTSDPDQITAFQLIQRNGKRLMNLINQLLDFKKLEVQEVKLYPSKGDIIAFLRDTVLSFSDLSEKKNISLTFQTSVDHLETLFDQDKLEKILFNLLSNAFKFTLENGIVSVNADPVKEDDALFLQIKVCDTGIGIPEDKLDRIFEPFFQNDLPKSLANQGSGIGLAITKEFVRIHRGRIHVSSTVGKGSCFTVLLPVEVIEAASEAVSGGTNFSLQPTQDSNGASHTEMLPEADHKPAGKSKTKSLLLIDDNDDFRFYLKDNLKFLYTIYEAKNGTEGWNQILSLQPDLVVSDIMMPEMNGIDLCVKIKSDPRVSHTSVILLTARSSEEQRIEGFKAGADDYITKPFNFEVLEARISNLLSRLEKSQKVFRKTLDVKASELQITPLDVQFVEKAIKCVEEHVSSPDFSVEDLGMELGISRAYVFRKILALTGKTPLEFIRSIRLQHAAQLLEKSQLSVREVAYKVGFNNPKYFTKYFKEHFNVLPSNYAALKKKEM